MRSVAQDWRKGSILAVDAGVHLSAIARLIDDAMPSPQSEPPSVLESGPFAGLALPHRTATANARHVASNLVDGILVTHAHLDHISGFVVNTAGPPGARPKKIAGLPSTIHALKTHIFNNVIWPNLTDENNGAGLLTYLRLVEGGSPALGDGEGMGYTEVCEGLLVKIWSVSHGHCIEKHSHRGSVSSASASFDRAPPNGEVGATAAAASPLSRHVPPQATLRRQSLLGQATGGGASPLAEAERETYCVYDSSAYFILDAAQSTEVLMFGDVEPDSISLNPRNLHIWQEAAPKVAAGTLKAIFIECSYEDSQRDDRLFGHLKPMFVMEELRSLAAEVASARLRAQAEAAEASEKGRKASPSATRKRKRVSGDEEHGGPATRRALQHAQEDYPISPKTSVAGSTPNALVTSGGESSPPPDAPYRMSPPPEAVDTKQLAGLKVVIIHVKDRLTDDVDVGETIMEQLLEHEKEAQLGCEFFMAHSGQSFYF